MLAYFLVMKFSMSLDVSLSICGVGGGSRRL